MCAVHRLQDIPGLQDALSLDSLKCGKLADWTGAAQSACTPPATSLFMTASLRKCLSSVAAVQGDKGSCDRNLAFNISWYLRSSVCYNEVFNTPVSIHSLLML